MASAARDTLFPLDQYGRFAVANPAALVPPMLLSLDGRYACDACDALTWRGDLIARASGYFCVECGIENHD